MIGLFMLTNKGDGPKATGDKNAIIRDTTHKQGSGAVQLVEYGDYQCPACGNAHPIVKQIMQEYDGKVTFYFRNFPLTQLHPNAMAAALAAEAANAQGKFWEMHDKLYEAQKEWSDLQSDDALAKFTEYAKALGMDSGQLKTAIENEQFKDLINQDMADGEAQNLQSTPSFYVNGKLVTAGYTYPALRDAIEAALKS
jgi:protein-disulfide isomerase